jgi:hypothetical protein
MANEGNRPRTGAKMSRAATIATLLIVSAALAAQPVFAAESAGGPSLGSALDFHDGGTFQLRDDASTMQPPSAPRPRNRVQPRLDLAALVDAYATVSHDAGGATTITPASPELRAAVEAELAEGDI